MHELSICQSLLMQVEQLAQQHHAQTVVSITVKIGPLSGVEADLLDHAFAIAREGSIAKDAELILDTLPVKIRCKTCQTESEVPPNQLVCQACGDWQTTLISGDELLLASVEFLQ